MLRDESDCEQHMHNGLNADHTRIEGNNGDEVQPENAYIYKPGGPGLNADTCNVALVLCDRVRTYLRTRALEQGESPGHGQVHGYRYRVALEGFSL